MILVSKSRVANVLVLLLLTLAHLLGARAADVSIGKAAANALELPKIQPRANGSTPLQRIFQAIDDELARRGISTRGELRPADLNFQSSVPALLVGADFRVKRIRFDPFRRAILFDLWASNEPRFLPFQVTLRDNRPLISKLAGGLDETGADVQTVSSTVGKRVGAVQPKPPILVKSGTPATVIMLGQNVRITMTVTPLQSGIRGQSILVRDVSSARVMTAEVVDENLLRMGF
jgi:hypothetical protein